ncbi:MAG: ABC transporter ATP-binding protein [Rubrivivax sp.]
MLRLELENISKQYPAVKANDRVSLRVQPGEIHAVLGENGAGKSTLMKIIYGAVRPDEGTMRFNGQPVQVASPAQARALGISMVYQHFSLFDTLTAAENVWLGLDRSQSLAEVSRRIGEVAGAYGLDVDPQRPVHALSVGERQRVEIVRALLTHPQLLILDEPTSVLTPQAVDKLFVTLRQLAAGGCSILYISHKLDEIRALCHHCTVLRGGRVTGEVDPTQETNASLSRLMIGAEPPPLRHRASQPGEVALSVSGLVLPGFAPAGPAVGDRRARDGLGYDGGVRVSMELRAGEILGIAGVSGNGQQALMATLSGEEVVSDASAICLFGEPVGRLGPGPRRRLGLHFVPEERLGRGAVPSMSLAHNTLLTRTEGVGAAGWLRLPVLQRQAAHLIERFRVKAGGPMAAARSLSGGNLQKFIVGREIDARPRVLLVSQPTWGVDVGAASQIRSELLALRDEGCAVLVVSEELDELFELADRLQVIARGRLSPSVPTAQATVEQIGQWMSGLWDDPASQHSGASGVPRALPDVPPASSGAVLGGRP